ncbi:non-seed lectin-like [Vicia villosa]|uniref:non-seed lectin-like n=1 Tax=Vicia villosa TaxID=3911 RepID=UPI00273B8E93|nr:non-seed lectin-like [Vicia villosa]
MDFYLFSLVSVAFVLLATNINSVHALSFNFTELTPSNPDLMLQGDAHFIATSGFVALTNGSTDRATGRALYKTPVTLWNETTGQVTSFYTSFSFIAECPEGRTANDGLIFFIAPPNTEIPENSESQYLGVVDSKDATNQFVGLEFDLYSDTFDPKMKHIGIDVNSLISLRTEKWNWVNGSWTKVSIIYDSPSKTLSALVTYESGEYTSIAQAVDLKTVLPNIVSIGFSATTISAASHIIHSWSFRSNLETTTSNVSDI